MSVVDVLLCSLYPKTAHSLMHFRTAHGGEA